MRTLISRPVCVIGVWLSAAVIAACGGGGGSGGAGTGGNPPAPPPPPPANSQPLAVSASNVVLTNQQAAYIVDSLMDVAINVADRTFEFIGRGTSYTKSCLNGSGTVVQTLQDNDGSGGLSAGDSAVLQFTTCEESNAGGAKSGTVVVDVAQLDVNSGVLFRGLIRMQNGFESTRFQGHSVAGNVELSVFKSQLTEVLDVRVPQNGTVTVSFGAAANQQPAVEVIDEFAAVRELREAADNSRPYELTFSLALQSEALGGSIFCETVDALVGLYRDEPVAGRYRCLGAANSRTRATAQNPPFNTRFILEYDDTGDGNFVEVAPSIDVGENLWRGVGLSFALFDEISGQPETIVGPVVVPPIDSVQLSMDIRDAVHDPNSNIVFVATGDRILGYEAASLTRQSETVLARAPSTLALSDDGSTLWIAYDGEPEMQPMRTADGSLGAVVSLRSPPPAADPGTPFAHSLVVQPGTTDVVIANVAVRNELVAFNSGVQLDQAIGSTTTDMPVFIDSDTVLFSRRLPTQIENLEVIDFDPVSGLQVTNSIPGIIEVAAGQLYADGQYLFAGAGRRIDLANRSIPGHLPRPFDLDLIDVVSSADGTTLFALAGGNVVAAYTGDPIRLGSAYKFDPFALGAVVATFATDQHLFVVTRNALTQIALADMVDNYPQDACIPSDLSGLAVPGRLFKLDCQVSGGVYDALRDDLILGIPGHVGPGGNSILFVEPLTGLVQQALRIGYTPGRLAISDDGLLLYVAIPEGSEVVTVSLNSRTLVTPVRSGFAEDGAGTALAPYFPRALAIASADARDVLVGMNNGDVAAFSNTLRAADIAGSGEAPDAIHRSVDGAAALVLTPFDSTLYDVSAAGIAANTTLAGVLPGNSTSQLDDEVFLVDGSVFDFQTGNVSAACMPQPQGVFGQAAAPISQGRQILYARGLVRGWVIDVCDRSTGAITPGPPISVFGQGIGELLGAYPMSDGLLALVISNGVVITDLAAP